MTPSEFIDKNPIAVLAVTLLIVAWATLQFMPSLNKLIVAALENHRRAKKASDDPEPEQKNETLEALKAMTITLQLFIETTSQRDARIGHLADTVAESNKNVTRQTEVLGKLAESIAQLALTSNSQSAQISAQTLKLTEFVGQLGAARQVGEDTRGDITRAVQAVDENKQSIEAQTLRISELKDQVAKLEKDVREDFLPMLQGIRQALDGLATKSDLAQLGEFSSKLNVIEAEVKALIVTMAISKPSEPQDTPAPAPRTAVVDTKPLEKADKPPEEKPSDKPTPSSSTS